MRGLSSLLLLLCPVALLAQETQPAVSLVGYATAPPTAALLMIGNRPVTIPDPSSTVCPASGSGVSVIAGVPAIATGAEVAVYGNWNKKRKAYAASGLCVIRKPDAEVSGETVIDAVRSRGNDIELVGDGRILMLAPNVLKVDPGLKLDATPRAGEWLRYGAQRTKDGAYRIKNAQLGVPGWLAVGPHTWKPVLFVAADPSHEGEFRPGRLAFTWKLPYDEKVSARLERLGEAVVPMWQKKLSKADPYRWSFQFVLAEKTPTKNCAAFPNGMVLVSRRTTDTLTDDAQLSALLAGCVATVLEEQAYRLNPHPARNAIAEAGLAVTPLVGAPALFAADIYSVHVIDMMQQQAARVGLTYLTAAGYSKAAAAAAWETLDGKGGVMKPQKQPSDQASLEYRAIAFSAPQSVQ